MTPVAGGEAGAALDRSTSGYVPHMFLLLLACAPEGPAAADLLAAVGTCVPLDGTEPFATDISDAGRPTGISVPLCGLEGAVWWTADLDIDCDGGTTDACKADPSYQTTTAATGSDGTALDASEVPYVVVPLPWLPTADYADDFFWCDRGLSLGGPALVIYGDTVAYGVIGDEGPVTGEYGAADGECTGLPYAGGVVGEASAAMAEALGVDGDPLTGGVDCSAEGVCGVTYVLFTEGALDAPEDRKEAEEVGIALATALVE